MKNYMPPKVCKKLQKITLFFIIVFSNLVYAQTNTGTVRILSGSTPGTSTDIIARLIAPKLSEKLGQPVIVENRPGLGGLLAIDHLLNSKSDNLNILITGANHATGAAMRKQSPFNPVGDFKWITTLTSYPMIVAVGLNSKYKTLEDLISYGQANPGKLSFSSVGLGTAHHLIGEWLNAELALQMVHIPYKGSPTALVDVISGDVSVMIDTSTFVLQQVKQGKLRALAISSATPSDDYPGVPVLSKFVKDLEYDSWIGLIANKDLSDDRVKKINEILKPILNSSDVKNSFVTIGALPKFSSPEEFKSLVERDLLKWNGVINSRNIPRQ